MLSVRLMFVVCDSNTSRGVDTKGSVRAQDEKSLFGWFCAMPSDSLWISDRDVNGFVVLVKCPSLDFLFALRVLALFCWAGTSVHVCLSKCVCVFCPV